MRILISDDDPVSLMLLESTLTEWGDEVVTAPDGIAAWDVLRKADAPRLAILDWIMPGFDGVEICRKVRAESESSGVYLIMLTGRTDADDIAQCIAAGADDYVCKPFDEQQLRVRLRAGRRIVELRDALAHQMTNDASRRGNHCETAHDPVHKVRAESLANGGDG